MRRFGGMIAFRVHGGRAAVDAALAETGVWTLGESLGGVESLIEHPGAMTHASLAGSGFEVPDDLIRLSVGHRARRRPACRPRHDARERDARSELRGSSRRPVCPASRLAQTQPGRARVPGLLGSRARTPAACTFRSLRAAPRRRG